MGGGLLLLLAEDVDIPARLVGNVRDVEAAGLLAESRHPLDFLGSKLDLLEVGSDAFWGHALRNDTVATDLRPGEDDLSGGDFLAESLGSVGSNRLDLVAGDQKRETEHVVTKGLQKSARC